MRIQRIIQSSLEKEFKLFLKGRGYTIDSSSFTLGFVEPQSFSKYREIEIDSARASVFGQLDGVQHLSKRFSLKKYLGLTDAEILENEKLWKEENPNPNAESSDQQSAADYNDDFSDLGNVGVQGGDAGLDNFADTDQFDDSDFDGSPIAGNEPAADAQPDTNGDSNENN